MTRPENHLKKLQHVGATWAKHCNQVLYMSSQSSDFPTVGLNVSEGRPQLYWKTIRAFQYIHAHHLQHADWFLKADDDMFVVVENLRHLLYRHDTEKPVYFGHRFRLFVRQGYMSGGAGYVLSPEALRRLVQGFSTGRYENFSSVEDMALGRCMETMGVKAGDSRDPKQRETLNPFRPENHLIAPENGKQLLQTQTGECQAPTVLYRHDTEKPVYFGHRFRLFVRQGYMSGGAGYVLSPEALRRLVQGFSTGRYENFSSVEDMALGSLDQKITSLPQRMENSYYRPRRGPDCCADFVISFHYMRPADMSMLEYFTHHLRPFGYKYRFNTNHEQNSTSELKHS
ncbi:glycoprotein-N-acetylgalactosamine 3-beta-galactosyltransferase 1-like [Sinocyclocheilus rhinocerous]|uniref:glycoprotein-N-acetylgalactosamine 3-beta-galactosyltransferase 1-like n=1 Tax=Sinocyclocheilus rhinocerous TaxID=307959 RepID=UPI0007BAA324|nr:PREDICTED: glycoprotein-N-acetylgalactosamine 3-beta-galactosyltransferase 1-like [Sinocyclocheilus rhinocerous]